VRSSTRPGPAPRAARRRGVPRRAGGRNAPAHRPASVGGRWRNHTVRAGEDQGFVPVGEPHPIRRLTLGSANLADGAGASGVVHVTAADQDKVSDVCPRHGPSMRARPWPGQPPQPVGVGATRSGASPENRWGAGPRSATVGESLPAQREWGWRDRGTGQTTGSARDADDGLGPGGSPLELTAHPVRTAEGVFGAG